MHSLCTLTEKGRLGMHLTHWSLVSRQAGRDEDEMSDLHVRLLAGNAEVA